MTSSLTNWPAAKRGLKWELGFGANCDRPMAAWHVVGAMAVRPCRVH